MNLETLILKIQFRLCKREEMHGIDVRISAYGSDLDVCRTKLQAALDLMRDCDPRRFAYLQRDIKHIFVMGAPHYRGIWYQQLALCELTDEYILAPETSPAEVASTLAHEAMHARLCRWGFDYQPEQRARVERICYQASMAFARRLPDSQAEERELILRLARLQMQRDPSIWTDESRIEATLGAMRTLGCPVWLLAPLRHMALARARRGQRLRERGDASGPRQKR